jgi:elongation factor G
MRLLKAIRHDAPDVATTAKRIGVKPGADCVAYVMKSMHTSHGGKMSIVRVLSGQIPDSSTFITPEREAGRVAGIFKLLGQTTEKRGPAAAG